jgi:hypothetical protein
MVKEEVTSKANAAILKETKIDTAKNQLRIEFERQQCETANVIVARSLFCSYYNPVFTLPTDWKINKRSTLEHQSQPRSSGFVNKPR